MNHSRYRQQAGFSVLELALSLSLLLPLSITAIHWGVRLQRDWQMEESAAAAARYVSDLQPSSFIRQTSMDEQIRMRCARFSELLEQQLPAFRLGQCLRIDSKTISVELQAAPRGLLDAAVTQSRWTLPDHH